MLLGEGGPAAERRPLPVLEEERRGVAVARERARGRGDHEPGVPVDEHALAGEGERGGDQLAPARAAELPVRERYACDDAGHRDGGRPFDVPVVLDERPGEEIGVLAAAGDRVVGGS